MKEFAQKRARLRVMPIQARMVYSIFLGFTLIGLVLTLALTHAMVGLDLRELEVYYAGRAELTDAAQVHGHAAEPAPTEASGGVDQGLVLELPPEAEVAAAPEPMAMRRLLEVTHFHLFSMPVLLVVLSHLYMLSQAGDRAKMQWIALASLATVVHIAAPWVARSSPGLVATSTYALSGSLLFISYVVMCLRPLWDMWGPFADSTNERNASAV